MYLGQNSTRRCPENLVILRGCHYLRAPLNSQKKSPSEDLLPQSSLMVSARAKLSTEFLLERLDQAGSQRRAKRTAVGAINAMCPFASASLLLWTRCRGAFWCARIKRFNLFQAHRKFTTSRFSYFSANRYRLGPTSAPARIR